MIPQKDMKGVLWLTMQEGWENSAFLLKYHPKYYKKVQVPTTDLQDRKIYRKIKRIKNISSVDIPDFSRHHQGLILSAYKGHNHHITDVTPHESRVLKYFPNISDYVLCPQILGSWRTFVRLTKIKTLTIEFSSIKGPSRMMAFGRLRTSRDFQWRFWSNFVKLKTLTCLSLHIYNDFDQDAVKFLTKLNSYPTSLANLRSFTLFLTHFDTLLQSKFDLFNLFTFITNLKIHELSFSSLHQFLQYLHSFTSLQNLNILKTLKHPNEPEIHENLSYLSSLSTLSHLSHIDLTLNFSSSISLRTFLDSFLLPASLTSLKLNFYETKWTSLISSDQISNLRSLNSFENNPLCAKFQQQWSNLPNLSSLSLSFCETESNNIPSLYFIVPCLRRITRLTTLFYANWSVALSEKIKALNFLYFWQAIQHLSGSLESLYLESYAISLRGITESVLSEEFSLKELGLCGFVLGDANLATIMRLFSSPRLNEENRLSSWKNNKLEMERLVIDNEVYLSRILGCLAEVPRTLDVSLNLYIRKISPETFVEIITHLVPNISRRSSIKLEFSEVPGFDLKNFEQFHKVMGRYQVDGGVYEFKEPREDQWEDFGHHQASAFPGLALQRGGDYGGDFSAEDDESFDDNEDLFDFEEDEEEGDSEEGSEEESEEEIEMGSEGGIEGYEESLSEDRIDDIDEDFM